MDFWQWTRVATVFTVGWAIIGLMMSAFWAPLPRPSSQTTWGYWIARCVVWSGLLISGVSGSLLVFLAAATTSPDTSSLGMLALAFAGGAVVWPSFLIYAVACGALSKCYG